MIVNAQINLDNGKTILIDKFELHQDKYTASKVEAIEFFSINIYNKNDVKLIDIDIKLNTSSCRYSYGLKAEKGIIINFEIEKPYKILALYHHRDWWTRPAFINNISDIPSRCISLFMQYDDYYYYALPVCGAVAKTEIVGKSPNIISFEVNTYNEGISEIKDFLFAMSTSRDFYNLPTKTFAIAREHHPNKTLLKYERKYPDMFDYLGFCSWNAFYKEVNESGLLEKADEFILKNIPVKWMLVDDGWQQFYNEILTSFDEDFEKFPNGFEYLTNILKKEKGIKYIGVWHTLGGYWGGVSIDKHYLYKTKKQKLLPCYEPEKGFAFWRDWYKGLKQKGIDFVKVDSQSALKNHYRNENNIGKIANGIHESLETAVTYFFDGRIINCMGMSSENMWNRANSAISRTSDDFVPDDKYGFAEHVLQNIYSSLYHGEMYYCDFDMFWSNHFDAIRHGVLRAVSGGPIYISDKIGESDVNTILPLVYSNGQIIRCDYPGLPSLDSIFVAPTSNGHLLKIINRVGDSGVIAMFNLNEKEIKGSYSISDIPSLSDKNYLTYDYFNKNINSYKIQLEGFGVGLVSFIQCGDFCTPIGLVDKYIPYHSIIDKYENNETAYIRLREGGNFAFTAYKKPMAIFCNKQDIIDLLIIKDDYYIINLPNNGCETQVFIKF